ncbi:MAG: ABC transporter ATP-binding protein [Flavobacteriaceae bacterium]|jgi:ATP-binding cassette, subfamily B, bacterial MsbA|nr:ABC transporter ATP-binding protein [Flavobacteriaceae bacterium]MBT4113312.1 ABC transporter ATP-binding protein [Flavobacteriaceae bacterium]MBT4614719.1 ABC transporter ATP-binding protein [Flavobacteriaceae bacterium]MBT5247083.1 ABC transporter ATP-binding protein [Flavobacteriaceae bacterium]MBT5649739.1 ABC transporter ATP-binding protein [Flavobacteriaceae bacterium]
MKNYFNRIFRYTLPYKRFFLLNIFTNIFYALFGTLSMISLFPMLKVLFNQTESLTTEPIWAGIGDIVNYAETYLNYFVTIKKAEGNNDVLIFMVSIIIVTFLLKNLFNYLSMFFITFLKNGVIKDFRNEIYNKIVKLSMSYYSEKKKGDIVARISSDVLEIDNSFLSIFELIIKEPLMILFTLISMYIISPELTGFVIIFIPISAIFISVVGKSLKRQSLKVQKEQGLFISLVDETLNGLKIVKIFNAENAFSRKFSESTNRLYKFSNSVINKKNLAGPLSEFLGICSIAIILWYGGMMVLKENSLDASTFLVYLGLAYNILTPAKSLSKASYKIRKAYGAAERVFQVLDDNRFIKSNEDDTSLENFSTSIDFNNVSFRYDNEDVIKNLSLIIKKGETVALVGQSGSGKSTIANLISRFYDISEGEIRVDGKNIKEVNLKSLRKLIGLVTQDSILFNDSIKNNLLIGKEDANDQEIIQALKIANAWEFVKELPETIENNIGDSGNKLSGGQKQRLSIARAVLKNPPIMILDEATSALDSESENLVQMALDNVMKNKTSLVIAHRLSTIQKADNILVLDKGKIIESGNHKDLMDKGGIYTNLVRMQTI